MVGLCLFLKHALALAHASRGGKCKSRIPFPKGGRSPVCTSEARKIKVALARARDGVPQQVWFPRGAASSRRSVPWGVAGYPRWVGESPRRGRSLFAGAGWSWGRAQTFPVLKG